MMYALSLPEVNVLALLFACLICRRRFLLQGVRLAASPIHPLSSSSPRPCDHRFRPLCSPWLGMQWIHVSYSANREGELRSAT